MLSLNSLQSNNNNNNSRNKLNSMYEIIDKRYIFEKYLGFLFHGEYHVENIKYEFKPRIYHLSLRDLETLPSNLKFSATIICYEFIILLLVLL